MLMILQVLIQVSIYDYRTGLTWKHLQVSVEKTIILEHLHSHVTKMKVGGLIRYSDLFNIWMTFCMLSEVRRKHNGCCNARFYT